MTDCNSQLALGSNQQCQEHQRRQQPLIANIAVLQIIICSKEAAPFNPRQGEAMEKAKKGGIGVVAAICFSLRPTLQAGRCCLHGFGGEGRTGTCCCLLWEHMEYLQLIHSSWRSGWRSEFTTQKTARQGKKSDFSQRSPPEVKNMGTGCGPLWR